MFFLQILTPSHYLARKLASGPNLRSVQDQNPRYNRQERCKATEETCSSLKCQVVEHRNRAEGKDTT